MIAVRTRSLQGIQVNTQLLENGFQRNVLWKKDDIRHWKIITPRDKPGTRYTTVLFPKVELIGGALCTVKVEDG